MRRWTIEALHAARWTIAVLLTISHSGICSSFVPTGPSASSSSSSACQLDNIVCHSVSYGVCHTTRWRAHATHPLVPANAPLSSPGGSNSPRVDVGKSPCGCGDLWLENGSRVEKVAQDPSAGRALFLPSRAEPETKEINTHGICSSLHQVHRKSAVARLGCRGRGGRRVGRMARGRRGGLDLLLWLDDGVGCGQVDDEPQFGADHHRERTRHLRAARHARACTRPSARR